MKASPFSLCAGLLLAGLSAARAQMTVDPFTSLDDAPNYNYFNAYSGGNVPVAPADFGTASNGISSTAVPLNARDEFTLKQSLPLINVEDPVSLDISLGTNLSVQL